MDIVLTEERRQVLATIRQFVERDVKPVARELEKRDEYPFAIVERLKELGLFGAFIPEAYGGLGLDYLTYAMVIEEICKGWMSVSGIINSHLMMAYAVWQFGTEAQRRTWLPAMCRGEKRGGVGLTEPHAGTDLQAIRTTAVRKGGDTSSTGRRCSLPTDAMATFSLSWPRPSLTRSRLTRESASSSSRRAIPASW